MKDIICDYCEEEWYYKPLVPVPDYFVFDQMRFMIPRIVPIRTNYICAECLGDLMESYYECR